MATSYNNTKNTGNNRNQNNRNNNNYNKNSGGKGNNSNYNGKNDPTKYVGAPYNFVPFCDKVYQYSDEKLTAHNDMKEELYTGEISYEITAHTPIMVGSGKKQDEAELFYKDAQGRYAIPGSTMRGLIRNNVQILGLSGFGDDIDDYALMYRAVAGGANKDEYKEILGAKPIPIDVGGKSVSIGILQNVRAGYIAKENGKYVIYKTKVDTIKKEYGKMNYYVLSEKKIVQHYLHSKKNRSEFQYDFFIKDGKSIMQHKFENFSAELIKGKMHYKGKKNQDYKPYYEEVSYTIANKKDVIKVTKPGGAGNRGYVISTGKMNEKKAIYIIPEIDKTKVPIEIPEKDVHAFQADYNKKKSQLSKKEKEKKTNDVTEKKQEKPINDVTIEEKFFALPKDEEIKPVFYIDYNGRLYFGFTPRLRLFYEYTIKDGLKEAHKKEGIDYSKAIFGYSNKNGSYKSKVSFSDAILCTTSEIMGVEKVILSEPKPSSFNDYLQPEKGNAVTYNNDGFQLRGVKQYWLHQDKEPCLGGKDSVATKMKPLPAGAKFRGKVRFQNMTKDELGLLLWSIKLKSGARMNVGKAKAYGYGNISLNVLSAESINMQKAYGVQTLDLNPFEDIDMEETIQYYKKTISKFLSGREVENLPHIQAFFKMKDINKIPNKDKIRYMNIDAREYQNRRVLPSIDKTLE